MSDNVVSSAVFNKLILKAQIKLDYYTNQRIKEYETEDIPEEVKITLAEFVDILNAYPASIGTGVLSSYSNGIETFGYAVDTSNPEKSLANILGARIRENLSAYPELICRVVSCG